MAQPHPFSTRMRLYNDAAERLYLNEAEFAAFIQAAGKADAEVRRFGLLLAYTGVRLSEARQLRYGSLQLSARAMSVETLKRRKAGMVREVPIPQPLATALGGLVGEEDTFIWGQYGRPIPRITAYRHIKGLMAEAGITGPRACPRGLRHSFGCRAILAGVPLHILQRWMGAQLHGDNGHLCHCNGAGSVGVGGSDVGEN